MKVKKERFRENNQSKKAKVKVLLKNNWQLYIMMLPVVIYLFVFNYMPMYGVQIAFRDYKIVNGITGSEWVGLKHFLRFFDTYYAKRIFFNTLILNVLGLLFGLPLPIIFAVLLNQIRNNKLKRFIQTTIYVPKFISTIVLSGMLYIFLAPSNGIFNTFRGAFGLDALDLMSSASAFRGIYIISGLWQGTGYSSILYIATLSSVDPTLYEAAEIDGATIWQKIRHIDFPMLLPTAMMQLILSSGGMLSSNTEKVLALQTSGNLPTSDIIGTYVFNNGINGGQFSYTAAIGLLTNIINLVIILVVNHTSKKVADVGMF